MRGVWQRKFRSTWGERVQEKEKWWGDSDVGTRKWMEGEEIRSRMCYEEREAIEHMWNGSSEMREREGKERGEILNGRGDKMDQRDMEEERKEREGERGRIEIKKFIFGNFWNWYFRFSYVDTTVIRNPKACRAKNKIFVE
jgi:hypothetical protein